VWFLHFVAPQLRSFAVRLPHSRLGPEARVEGAAKTHLYRVHASRLDLQRGPSGCFRIVTFSWSGFAPLLLMGALTAIRGFTQHGITEASDPYLASRTMLPSPMVAFFLLNENYHLEHHLFPEVPSYHLPALHELIWPKLPRAVSAEAIWRFWRRSSKPRRGWMKHRSDE